jgi:hypothetical protein
MTMPGAGASGESLPGATAGRQAERVLPFPPRLLPAARWAAARDRGPRAAMHAAGPFRTADASDPRRPRLQTHDLQLPNTGALCTAASWVDGSSVSCGCWRAADVRHAARMTMPAWGARGHWQCSPRAGLVGAQPAVTPAARWGGGPATAGRERQSARQRWPVRWWGGKLVYGFSVSWGCWRADLDVRQAARMTMPTFARRSAPGGAAPGGAAFSYRCRRHGRILTFPPGVPRPQRWAAARRPAGRKRASAWKTAPACPVTPLPPVDGAVGGGPATAGLQISRRVLRSQSRNNRGTADRRIINS